MGRQSEKRSKKQQNSIAGRMENGGDSLPVFPQGSRLARPALRQLVDCVHGAKLPVFILEAMLYFAKKSSSRFFNSHFLRWARHLGRFGVVKKKLSPLSSLPL